MNDGEARSRTTGQVILGLVFVLFIGISAASFDVARARPDPETFVFQGQSAVEGKRVFQAYNCMGCHTILGNGAYFGPDLTKVYEDGGSAWLRAFLSSPGTWPTEAALNLWVERQFKAGDLDISTPETYYAKYPHVLETMKRLGGARTAMPNLRLLSPEISALTAFLRYMSAIDTQGWPPAARAEPTVVARMLASLSVPEPPSARPSPPAVAPAAAAPSGEKLAGDLGCLACHSTDGSARIGGTFKGLAGATVTLADGTTTQANADYLRESILKPDAKVPKGYSAGLMPSYDGQVSSAQLDALVAFITSLKQGR